MLMRYTKQEIVKKAAILLAPRNGHIQLPSSLLQYYSVGR